MTQCPKCEYPDKPCTHNFDYSAVSTCQHAGYCACQWFRCQHKLYWRGNGWKQCRQCYPVTPQTVNMRDTSQSMPQIPIIHCDWLPPNTIYLLNTSKLTCDDVDWKTHAWLPPKDSQHGREVKCVKCGVVGERETDGSVYFPAT